MKKEDLKILIYSALISANTIIWYEILGAKFFFMLLVVVLYFVFVLDKK